MTITMCIVIRQRYTHVLFIYFTLK